MSFPLFRKLLFIVVCVAAVGHLQAQQAMRDKIIAWKKSLTVNSTYSQYANVLSFPVGNISQELWTSQVLAGLTDKNEIVRKRVAYIIGEKKLYPAVSVPALIRLLNDPSDSVATNAIFALTVFGPRIIRPLFEVMQKEPRPYVSRYLSEMSYEDALKRDKEEAYSFSLSFFYSRSAMRAMFSLRFMGDTVLYYMPQYLKIKDYYKVYLLDGITISASNFDLYSRCVDELISRQIDLSDSEYNKYLWGEYVFKRLIADCSLDDAKNLLRNKDTSLLRHFDKYLQENKNYSQGGGNLMWFQLENHPDSLPERLKFYYDLNLICMAKDSFFLYRGRIAEMLKHEGVDWILMVLLANMGDSARSLTPELLRYIGPSHSKDIQYLAIKALINIHLRSDSTYVLLPPGIIAGYNPEMSEDEVFQFRKYFFLSDELNEGFGIDMMKQHLLTGEKYNNEDFAIGKIYLDRSRNRVTKNCRWLDAQDTAAVHMILEFARHKDRRVRLYAAYALGLCDSTTTTIKDELIRLASDDDSKVQKAACFALLQTGASGKDVNAFSTVYILENYFNESIADLLKRLTYGIDIPPFVYEKGGSPSIVLPGFPNPPPQPSVSGLAVFKTAPAANTTLGDVYKTLRDNLKRNEYYDLSSFHFEDGFALQTRMERIKNDGSIDYVHRYTRTKIKPKGIGDYFYQLFCGERGGFRGLTFIVCTRPTFAPYGKDLVNENSYDLLFAKGSGGWLTDDISVKLFAGKNIHILVYEYGKSAEGVIQFTKQSLAQPISTHFNTINLSSFKLR